jgi:hypothetical protein
VAREGGERTTTTVEVINDGLDASSRGTPDRHSGLPQAEVPGLNVSGYDRSVHHPQPTGLGERAYRRILGASPRISSATGAGTTISGAVSCSRLAAMT